MIYLFATLNTYKFVTKSLDLSKLCTQTRLYMVQFQGKRKAIKCQNALLNRTVYNCSAYHPPVVIPSPFPVAQVWEYPLNTGDVKQSPVSSSSPQFGKKKVILGFFTVWGFNSLYLCCSRVGNICLVFLHVTHALKQSYLPTWKIPERSQPKCQLDLGL